ncbi:hypothetical protein TRIATDRAFT_254899 [Trichoderma atroviride IMI 206040]|uniref:Uncharacterized protein n=1 Tax=Hypocrea atroviridis (strain ATCC 20476 / IMI 206040) TaxID=452589 RepID=G9NIP6_HYPAI|nr:uncharacterized protein TRIATDRAFT_254899 [Trichoderma atroviride IMI 206040]EHK49657.1 hypothetical protein TRIATDRAFT_254899 [Trichoderma atroviride IMI 206040]
MMLLLLEANACPYQLLAGICDSGTVFKENLVKGNDVGLDANMHKVTTYGRTNAKEVNGL